MKTYSSPPIFVKRGNSTFVYPTVCFSYQEEKRAHGIFYKANVLEFIYPVFTIQIILAFLVSWTVYFVLRPLRQPRFVCNILAGIILGPSVLGRNKAFMETFFPPKEMLIFNTVARLGTAYLIFIIAVKMDVKTLLSSAKKIWPIGLCSYIFPFVITLIFSSAMYKELSACLKGMNMVTFLCGAISVTYFPVVAQFIEELDLLTTELGQLALSSSMLIQMTSHAITIIGVAVTRDSYIHSIYYFLAICATIILAVYVIRPAILLSIKITPEGKPIKEVYVIAILIGTLIMAVITDVMWYDFLSGALLTGLIIPDGPPLGAILVEKSELMVMEIFLPLFFVQVGYLTDVSSLQNIKAVTVVLLLVTVCCLTKIIGTLLASLYLNIKFQTALFLGLILNFKGVVDLTTFHRFQSRNILEKRCYTALVLFNLLVVAIFYPLIEFFYKPRIRLAGRYSKTKYSRALQSTPQAEELRALTCIYHENNVPGMIALLDASNHRAISPLCAYVVHVVDLVGRTAPSLLPYKGKTRMSNHDPCSSSSRIMSAFINYSKTASGRVSLQPFTMVAPFRTMHNIICNLAEENLIPFIIVPFHENQILDLNSKQKGVLQDFNSQLQAHAPCTVGILYDRGLQPRLNKCRIVVVFIGGADDREALALAIRMSGNPDMNITMLRINSAKDKDRSITEAQLDELLVKEFIDNNLNNPRILCQQVSVNDSLQMLNAVQSLRRNYDLVMVGKNSGARAFEKDLTEWVEYAELGVIGDMLASTDFYNEMTSVLVMEHCAVVNKSFSIPS
ncbi:K(+)/H(+) antiporter, putative [Ricinus communis]|uniref:K(+)/H(+) antiporter, putative n=1 Tax=Ricinus communis TaxID=3988 RepID=B9STD0_RICCO|nr:K(+)/H(+) antiporter, putative [Ricinus communis]|eukprot:XP_002529249.1 cation/H(+) antiporter 15 [Ricinus communis]